MSETLEDLPIRPRRLRKDAEPDLFKFRRVAVHVPVNDAVETHRCLVFLADEAHKLANEMNALTNRHAKALLAQTTMRRWNHVLKNGVPTGRK